MYPKMIKKGMSIVRMRPKILEKKKITKNVFLPKGVEMLRILLKNDLLNNFVE